MRRREGQQTEEQNNAEEMWRTPVGLGQGVLRHTQGKTRSDGSDKSRTEGRHLVKGDDLPQSN